MAIQFFDRYSSTLASSYTSGGSSLVVASAGSGLSALPASGDFYVVVEAEGANTEEVFKVTARSGTTLTVTGAQAGTTASNHASGASILGPCLTAAAMTQMKADTATSMTTAAFDTETTTGTLNPNGRGSVNLSDGAYEARWTGSAWEYYHNSQKMTPPSLLTATLLNATSGSVTGIMTSSGKTLNLYSPKVGGENWRLASFGSLPGGATYNLTVAVRVLVGNSQTPNAPSLGMWIGDTGSTPKAQFFGFSINSGYSIRGYRLSNPTTYGGSDAFTGIALAMVGPLLYLRISLASSNHSFKYSIDGVNWVTIASGVSATAFLSAPAQWGVCVNAGQTTADPSLTCYHAEAA